MLNDTQLAQRIGKATSSIVAGALGLHPYMTPLQAWMSATGRSPDIGHEKPIERGNLLEDVVLDYPCHIIDGLERREAPFRCDLREWAGDSADALYYLNGEPYAVGEGKTAALGSSADWGEEGSDEIPLYHLVQCHWHLLHWTMMPRCLTPVLIGGYAFEFRLYVIERESEVEGDILQRMEKWHRDYVVNDVPPPASSGDADALAHLFPRDTRPSISPTKEIETLARERAQAAEIAKQAAAHDDALKNRIKQLMADAGECKGAGWKVTWRTNKPSEKTDWKAIARELGADDETIARHTTEKEGARVLRVTVE